MKIYFQANASPADVEQRLFKPFYAMLAGVKNGVDVELSEHKHRRSTAQNAFYWANIQDPVHGGSCPRNQQNDFRAKNDDKNGGCGIFRIYDRRF